MTNSNFIISLDEIDLDLLRVYEARRKDEYKKRQDKVPIWSSNSKLWTDNYYYEFGVIAHDEPETSTNATKIDSTSTVTEQLDLRTYLRIIAAVPESPLMHNVIAVDDGNIEIETSSGTFKVSADNFHGYCTVNGHDLCRVCRIVIDDKETHKLSPVHMRRITAPIKDTNCIRQIDPSTNHCIICNEMIQNSDLHVRCDPYHIFLLNKVIVTSTNSVNKGNNAETINRKTTSTIKTSHKAQTANVTALNILETEKKLQNGTISANKTSQNEKDTTYSLALQGVTVNATSSNDLATSSKKSQNVVSSNLTVTRTGSADTVKPTEAKENHNLLKYCDVCKANVPTMNFQFHLASDYHKRQEKIVKENNENMHFCSVCQVKVPNNDSHIAQHEKGGAHRKRLLENMITDPTPNPPLTLNKNVATSMTSAMSSNNTVAPTAITSNKTIAPSATSSNNTVAPTAITSNKTIAPSAITSNKTFAPSATSSNNTVAPTAITSNKTIAPSAITSNKTFAPSATSSNNTVAPSATSSNNTVAPSAMSSNNTVAPSATTNSKLSLLHSNNIYCDSNANMSPVNSTALKNNISNYDYDFCRICKVKVTNNVGNITEHEKGITHKTKLNDMAKTGNSTINNEFISNYDDDFCRVCNVQVSNNVANVIEHERGITHRTKLKEIALKIQLKPSSSLPSYKPPSNPSSVYANVSPVVKRDDSTQNYHFCDVCQVKVPNNTSNIFQHQKGTSHTMKLSQSLLKTAPSAPSSIKSLSSSSSSTIRELKDSELYYWCDICDVKVSNNTSMILQHNNEISHIKKYNFENNLTNVAVTSSPLTVANQTIAPLVTPVTISKCVATSATMSNINVAPLVTPATTSNINVASPTKSASSNNKSITPLTTSASSSNKIVAPLVTPATTSNISVAPLVTPATTSNINVAPLVTPATTSNISVASLATSASSNNKSITPLTTSASSSNKIVAPLVTPATTSNSSVAPSVTPATTSNSSVDPLVARRTTANHKKITSCEICNIRIRKKNLQTHLRGNHGKENLEYRQPSMDFNEILRNVDRKPSIDFNEILRNMDKKPYVCGICNVKVPNNASNIQTHNEGASHRGQLEIAREKAIFNRVANISAKNATVKDSVQNKITKSNTNEANTNLNEETAPIHRYKCEICDTVLPNDALSIKSHETGIYHRIKLLNRNACTAIARTKSLIPSNSRTNVNK